MNSAKLELYVEAQPRTGSATSNLYAASKEWNEMEATWFMATESDWWEEEGGDFKNDAASSFDFPSNAINKWHDFDVTDIVQKFIDSPESNFGFHFKMSVAMVTLEYVSSESGKKEYRPKLTLDIDQTGISTKQSTTKYDDIRLSKLSDSYALYLPYSGSNTISIYDVKGKLLSWFVASKGNRWQMLPVSIGQGIHIVRIHNKEKEIFKKIWFIE